MRTSALPAVLAAIVTLFAWAPARADGPSTPGTPPVTGAAAATPTAGPRVVFDGKTFNFGKAVCGTDVQHVFALRNTGSAELAIRAVKPSCGCTAAAPSRDHIAPGASAEIAVTFKSAERVGPQHVQVQVYTNDPLEKDLGDGGSVLVLNGEMVSLLQIMPATVYVATVLHGTPQSRTVTVVPVDVETVTVKSIEPTPPWLHATTRPYSRSGKHGFEIQVDLAADAPIGRLDERLVIHTDHPKQETLRVGVFGTIHGKMSVFPERIMLFSGEAASNHDQVLYVQRVGGPDDPLPIAAVEAPPFLEAQVVEVIAGKRSEIRLSWKPDAPHEPVAGVIRVFMRDPEQPLFEIPVVGERPRTVKVEPVGLWLEGAGPSSDAVLRVTGGEVTGISKFDMAGLPIVASVEKAPDGASLVHVRLAADAPAGPFGGMVYLETKVPGEERIGVPVRGEVKK